MAKAQQFPELVDIDLLKGAEYNPRKVIPERLEQVKLSLSKLGFLLPVYASEDNTILSGHQRTTAARLYGYTKIPVVRIPVDAQTEKGLNIVFNKGTNDLDTFANDAKLAFTEYLEQAATVTAELPDIPPDTYYPCMEQTTKPLGELMSLEGMVDVSPNLRTAGSTIVAAGIHMPVVMSGGKVVNGKGRVYGYSSMGIKDVPVVEIPEALRDYAFMALNFLAMDFDIQKNFTDELRYNAFRRRGVQAQLVGLSRTYTYFVYNRLVGATNNVSYRLAGKENPDLKLMPTASQEAAERFRNTYGHNVIDFGAGTLHDSRLMQSAGFNLIPFEPYYCGEFDSTPNSDESRKLAGDFLDKVEALSSKGVDSIISSFVLNSIPHHKDRMAYLILMGALCKYNTKAYIGTQAVSTVVGGKLGNHLRLSADEPNVTLGNDARFFKAQKFYHGDELSKLLKVVFLDAEVKVVQGHVFAKCGRARKPNPNLLKEAIELEFNLPYGDGTTMNLVDRAKEVFSKYTGIPL